MRSLSRNLPLALLTIVITAACSDGPLDLVAPPEASEAKGGTPGKPGGGGGGGGGEEGGGGFTDDFDTFDEARWFKQEHTLGRSYLDPSNVSVSNGNLLLRTPGNTDGAEIRSKDKYGYGYYEVTMAAAPIPGTTTTFFMYESGRGRYIDEIDIELLPHRNEVIFAIWRYPTSLAEQRVAVDDVTAMHTYAIDYEPGRISFYIDGQPAASFEGDNLPSSRMYLMANLWWPSWVSLADFHPDGQVYNGVYDRIVARPY